jgi:hypothetical protein
MKQLVFHADKNVATSIRNELLARAAQMQQGGGARRF